MERYKITPDGYIGVSVSGSRNEAALTLEREIIDFVSKNTGYSVTKVIIPGMGSATGGPHPDFLEMIRMSFEIAGYLGAAWKTEQFFRQKAKSRIDKKARKQLVNRQHLFIVLTHGEPIPDLSVRRLTVRDLVALLPYLREKLSDVENFTLMIMGKSASGNQVNFSNLKLKDLQGKALRRMIKVSEREEGPIGYTSEDLNMLIFKPNSRLY